MSQYQETEDLAKIYFPHATDEVAALQLHKLLEAKETMRKKKRLACMPKSEFEYVPGGMKK